MIRIILTIFEEDLFIVYLPWIRADQRFRVHTKLLGIEILIDVEAPNRPIPVPAPEYN